MTIDEAITHAREVVIEQSSIATELSLAGTDANKCIKCKQEHEQLAEWLEELKAYRENEGISENVYKMGYKFGHNKAVDDFLEKVKEVYAFTILEEEQLNELAEKLKEGCVE